jgi:hypothetical protein
MTEYDEIVQVRVASGSYGEAALPLPLNRRGNLAVRFRTRSFLVQKDLFPIYLSCPYRGGLFAVSAQSCPATIFDKLMRIMIRNSLDPEDWL